MMSNIITHPIKPVFNKNSQILILGSFPSVKSRNDMFFYAHPQNRFWRVVSAVFGKKTPITTEEKRSLLLSCRIALWDVIKSCEITGSSDASIKNAVANDLSHILQNADIKQIYTNGKTAFKFYNKYTKPAVLRDATYLPSTSPANAAFSFDALLQAWNVINSN